MRTVFLALLVACTPGPDEPASLAYDHVACDHCGMVVGDPRFAVQMTTRDGERFEFDDPSCAFEYVAEKGPSIAHLWFRDSTSAEDEWIPWASVGFVPARGTPMDGGLAAVPLPTEGAIGFAEASSRFIGGAK